MIPNLSAKALKQSNFGVVCVCRAPESDLLRSSVRNEWKNCLWIAEDTAIIDASIEKVPSQASFFKHTNAFIFLIYFLFYAVNYRCRQGMFEKLCVT